MRLESADYPDGIDYEWFAVDAAGCVAAFTTGGVGPVPVTVLASHAAVDSLDEFILRLPVRGTGAMCVSLPRPDDYLAFAERGVFAYDWADVHRAAKNFSGVYELYSRPSSPITISELPAEFQRLLRDFAFNDTQFNNSTSLDVRTLIECNEAVT